MKWAYVVLVIVLVVSIATIARADREWVSRVAEVPAIGAMFAGLYLLMKDRIAHERTVILQQSQNAFAMGATSHMANVAFDKHVSFGEEYVTEVFETVATLFRRGPCQEALDHASNLYRIRQKWALWITPTIETDLEQFEKALRSIGANAYVNDAVRGENDPGRQDRVREMYARFAEVMGFERWQDADVSQEHATSTIIKKLQKVLGTDELTSLRNEFVQRALRSEKDSTAGA
jgi:hypothetical protein